jgi:hypothetical protein
MHRLLDASSFRSSFTSWVGRFLPFGNMPEAGIRGPITTHERWNQVLEDPPGGEQR